MKFSSLAVLLVIALLKGQSLASVEHADLLKLQKREADRTNTEDRLTYDPCLNSRHIEINDPRRTITYDDVTYNTALDDGRFPRYWYRFTSGAGGEIPTSPPLVGRCGTVYPIWMDGTVPVDDDDEHTTSMCMTNGVNPRYQCQEAKVKNCTDYIVYHLSSAMGEKSAYCAGSGAPCGEQQTSPTGYSPCEHVDNVPAIPKPPEVTLNENNDTYFFLECHLNQPDSSAIHDVRWIADGNIFHRQTLQPGETFARLIEDAMRFRTRTIVGYSVSCEVSARKAGFSVGSKFTKNDGDGYFLGFQFVDVQGHEVREIVIKEDDKNPGILYLRPSAPVRCNSPAYQSLPPFLRGPCKISVKVRNGDLTEFAAQLLGKCSREKQVSVKELAEQIRFGECRVNLTIENWKDFQQHRILINAIQDKVFDGQQSRYIDLDVQAINQAVWDNYEPPYVKVTIKDTSVPEQGLRTCKSLNDPHMTTFDGLKYENMLVGEFVLYENHEYNFRVHVYFIKCNNNIASCNCGVAAQAGDDVILFDRCNKLGDIAFGDLPDEAKEKGFLRQKVLTRGQMTQGFSLEHTKGTNKYTIRFPHGAELHISVGSAGSEHINLEMVPSQEDYADPSETQKVRGLCGTFSKDVTDDLVKYGGDLYPPKPEDHRNNRFYPNDFSESWRVPAGNERSMYNGQIYDVRDFTGHKMCACLTVSGIDQAVCAFGSECREDEDLTDLVGHRTARRRRRRDAGHDHVRDFDDGEFTFNPQLQTNPHPDETWPTPGGMTKRQARTFCDNLIKKAPFYEKCKALSDVNLNEDIDTCVIDIGLTGTTDFAVGIREAAESKCNERITSDMNEWRVNPGTQLHDPARLIKFKELKEAKALSQSISGSRIAASEENEAAARPLMTIRHGPARDDSLDTFVPNPAIVDVLCPESCNARGRCVNQKCQCNLGFAGKSCGFQDGPPTIYSVPLNGLCDKRSRPCRSTPVIGKNFIESDNLKCIFKYERRGRSTRVIMTTPEYESYMEIHCPIPAVNTGYEVFKLQVSNNKGDSRQMSAPVRLVVYDSKCVTCTSRGCIESATSRDLNALGSRGFTLPRVLLLAIARQIAACGPLRRHPMPPVRFPTLRPRWRPSRFNPRNPFRG